MMTYHENVNLSTSPMKRSSTTFLQIVVVLIGIGTLTLLLLEPRLEGKNAGASTFEIYFKDPFLACVYLASVAWFVILYNAIRSLQFVKHNTMFSPANVKALQTIKYCATFLIGCGIAFEAYINIFMRRVEEDIAGGVVMGLMMIFFFTIIATAAGMFQRVVQQGSELKSENDLTV